MKKINQLPRLMLFLFVITSLFVACEKEEDDNPTSSIDSPWDRQFYFGKTNINGIDIITHEVTTANAFIEDYVCYDDLPSSNLETFSVHIFVPKISTIGYKSGITHPRMWISYDDKQTEDISIGSSLKLVGQAEINGNKYSEFILEGSYTSNSSDYITKYNFQQIRVDFTMTYLDQDENEISTTPKYIKINLNSCG